MVSTGARSSPLTPAARVAVIGAGLAGNALAEQLRREGFTGPIDLIEAADGAFDRPPLSKDLMAGWFDAEAVSLTDAYRLGSQRIDAHFGRAAVSLRAASRTIALDDGTEISADAIVLATGTRPRKIDVPGADAAGVLTLHSLEDSLTIRRSALEGGRVLIIGGGMVGAELAAAMRTAGAPVTMIVRDPVPLEGVLGDETARHLHAMHQAHGVEVVVGEVVALRRRPDGRTEVVLSGGEAHAAQTVICAIGADPRTELAVGAGLVVDDGIVVDEYHRTGSAGVYAIGDAARRADADGGLPPRGEHWEGARLDAEHLAAFLLGLARPARGAPWFWTERYGVRFEMVGTLVPGGCTVIRRGDEHPIMLHVAHGRLLAASAIDDPQIIAHARAVIDSGMLIDSERLADPSLPLADALAVRA